ncbi:MAG TPA: thiamine pyrophosphate-binding protein [Rhodopila sp.]|uniref:thiamine pyrophosphate-binding protein n=1 Tax=Rhodopila sp. TaxID=2480087 RepID=UPI002C697994|nr:thiamine pyrophosphate-binding protein [Rhodopila sp.]HVY13681.1 thiamine pyrophosphate-binding protein [Rhodopila sp.]
MPKLRGADIVVRTLENAGLTDIFTLSGNHIMSLFDAAIDSKLTLFHVRHEAATVHMADSYGRLTGRPGIAWVTGGPGHANAVGALFTALGQETPMILMSGHTETDQLGRGGFQELRQVDMAAPVCKAAWMATDTATVGMDVAKAVRIATAGRPGPVALSLPSDVLDATVDEADIAWPTAADFTAEPVPLSDAAADAILSLLADAKHPLVIAAPVLATAAGRTLLRRIESTLHIPACISEGPRSFNDASLGAYLEVAKKADLVLLLGKAMDFTVKFGGAPFAPDCRFIAIDPDGAILNRAVENKGKLLAFGCVADTVPAARTLIARGTGRGPSNEAWLREAHACFYDRPADWKDLRSATPDKLHPAQVFQTLQRFLTPDSILIADGGEFSQWGQSILRNERRMINGVTGSIGSSLPMAAGARVVDPKNPVFAVLGDGTFGFHMAEVETAVRCNLPFVAIVGTDCRWNAEYNLQVRDYGPNRTFGCELNATRYDLVAEALGGHGELVTKIEDLGPAIERSLASEKPAVINVMIESIPSPVIRR